MVYSVANVSITSCRSHDRESGDYAGSISDLQSVTSRLSAVSVSLETEFPSDGAHLTCSLGRSSNSNSYSTSNPNSISNCDCI